jgi:hypothetical protein
MFVGNLIEAFSSFYGLCGFPSPAFFMSARRDHETAGKGTKSATIHAAAHPSAGGSAASNPTSKPLIAA